MKPCYVTDSNEESFIVTAVDLSSLNKIGTACLPSETQGRGCKGIFRFLKLYLNVHSFDDLNQLSKLNSGLKIELHDGIVYVNNHSILECCQMFITALKEQAEQQSHRQFSMVSFSFPADFDLRLIDDMEKMMKNCHFNEVVKLSEPVAAATTYIVENNVHDEKLLIIDIGGGTCDLSIIVCDNENSNVVYKTGSNSMGGTNIDTLVYKWLINQIKCMQYSLVESLKSKTKRKIWNKCIEIKEKLSSVESVTISLNEFLDIYDDEEFYITITRQTFESVISSFVSDFIQFVKKAVRQAENSNEPFDMLAKRINRVILVGGPSVIPLLHQKVKMLFPSQLFQNIDPRNVVAKGDLYHASKLLQYKLTARNPIILKRGAGQRTPHVSSDKNVSIKNCIVNDTLSEPLSILEGNGRCFHLLGSGVKLEETRDYYISVTSDNQTEIHLFFCQGADPLFINNRFLGSLMYKLPPSGRLKSDPQFVIKVWVNYNSVFNVCLEDLLDKTNHFFVTSMLNKNPNQKIVFSKLSTLNMKDGSATPSPVEEKPEVEEKECTEQEYLTLVNEIERKICSNLSKNISQLSELVMIKRDHTTYKRALNDLIARLEELQKSIRFRVFLKQTRQLSSTTVGESTMATMAPSSTPLSRSVLNPSRSTRSELDNSRSSTN